MTMTKTGLSGPYRLSFDAIDAAVTRKSAGVYALGHTDAQGRFCVNHVGRSDSDVRSRLLDFIREGVRPVPRLQPARQPDAPGQAEGH